VSAAEKPPTAGQGHVKGVNRNYGPIYTAPMFLWLTLLFLVPLLLIVVFSFLTSKGQGGGVEWAFSLDAYAAVFVAPVPKIALDTLMVTVVSTSVILLLAFPASYYMARSPNSNLLLILIFIPFWTNFIIRVFAWKFGILGKSGLLIGLLSAMGVADPPSLVNNSFATILVTIYIYLPYAILPLYSTIEKFDFSLLEAARDLGASKPAAIIKILVPNVKSGIATAILFTFIPILGSFAIPKLVGGLDVYLGQHIDANKSNWPFVSALSVILMALTVGASLWLNRMEQPEDKRAVSDSLEDQGIKPRRAAPAQEACK
jgi:spermidine/putrescine transport system permease protein